MIYYDIAQYNIDSIAWYSILERLHDHTAVVGRRIKKTAPKHGHECQFVCWARGGARGVSNLGTETGNTYNIIYDSTIYSYIA